MATASPAHVASLSGCPAARSLASLTPLARFSGDADDVAITAAGDVWVSLRTTGALVHLDGAGKVLGTVADPQGPEGIVPLPDGRLAVAEQVPNRVDVLDPRTGTLSTLATLPKGAGDGVDGIEPDFAHNALLVPDSAAGTLLSVDISSGAVSTLVSGGLGRPVSAARLGDGSVMVAVENAPGLYRVDAAGHLHTVTAAGALPSVDEVIADGGVVYVTDLIAGTLDAVDATSGALRTLVSGAPAPQGLSLTGRGTLLLTDSTRQVLVEVAGC